MRNNSFWLKMCSTALCFTKAFSGMLKQVDKIQMISSKLFVKNVIDVNNYDYGSGLVCEHYQA